MLIREEDFCVVTCLMDFRLWQIAYFQNTTPSLVSGYSKNCTEGSRDNLRRFSIQIQYILIVTILLLLIVVNCKD